MKKNRTHGLMDDIGLLKMIKMIRFTIFILLLSLSQTFAVNSYSQQTKLSLDMKNVRVEDVIDRIEKNSEFFFMYNKNRIDVDRKVDIQVAEKNIDQVLDKLFGNTGISYTIKDRQILLINSNLTEVGNEFASQQGKSVSGKVTDSSGAPLAGVTVVIKGTTTGIITDTNGNYLLSNVPPDAVFVFSFVGMKTQEVKFGNKKTIDVILAEEAIGLEEVVAVGYGTQKKVNMVGSVASVSGEKIASIPASDITNAISGRLPGSTVMQKSGEPGNDDAKITVRGRTTLGGNTGPLIVIDGIPGRSLVEVDPVDIESISILKDASAAIYGAQAANGVILVTTKKGKDGKPSLNYQFYQGFMTPTMLPKVLNAGDYATMLGEWEDYNHAERTYADEDIALYYNGKDPWEHPNSDWMSDLIAKWTMTTKHNITFDGGSNGMHYYLSFGYKKEDAIYKQESTNYKQYNLRAKLDLPITSWLKTSFDYAGFLNSSFYPTASAGSIYGQSTRIYPTYWSFWPNGKPGPDIEYGDNPVVTSSLEGGYDDTKDYKNEMTFNASIAPPMVKGLIINGMFTMDIYNTYRKQFQKPWTLYYPNWASAIRNSEGFVTSMDPTPKLVGNGFNQPQLHEDYNRFIRKLGNISINYSHDFGAHSIALFGAYEQLEQNSNAFGAFRKYYITDVVQTLNAGSNVEQDITGSMSIYGRKSWIGRFNYDYKDKYLLEVLFRRDGSLKFPPNSRWGNFPAAMIGWRASEENFWKENIPFINYFKLRASYGKMGMDPGDPFQYMNKYAITDGVAMGTSRQVETTVNQSGVANQHITWEKQTTYNAGFESKILNNMFSLNADVFYNERSDILAPRNASVPQFTGIALPDENIAKVNNRGFEIEAGYHKKFNNDLRLDVSGNISYNHNKVVFMDEPVRSVAWQERTGHPYGATLMYKAIGIFADQAAVDAYPHWKGAGPGDVIFEDVSGDSLITSDDQILLDKTDSPEIFYGITLDIQYKNWTLSVLAQGQGTYYQHSMADGRRGIGGNYFQWEFDNRWTPENTTTNVARAWNRSDAYWVFGVNESTYYWDNMAYCRLKNVILTYKIPKQIFGRSGISNVDVYFSGNNLALLYAAQHNFDPEIAAPMTYPAVKTFAIGAKITF